MIQLSGSGTLTLDAVVREFDHHSASVSCVSYVTGSSYLLAVAEDNNLSIINTTSMTLERTMNYSLGRMWAVSYNFDVSGVYAAIGCDQGLAVVRIGESTLKYASMTDPQLLDTDLF